MPPIDKARLQTTQVLELHKDMVFSIALTHSQHKIDAEDIFQEVFLVYHRKQPCFDNADRLKAWLIVTTLNCAKQVSESSWRKRHVLTQSQENYKISEEAFHFRTDEQELLFDELLKLPTKYRTILHLFYFEDLSIAQISEILSLTPGTVKVQLSRGRAQLREKLKGEYFHD